MLFYFYKIHDFRFLGDHSIIPHQAKKPSPKLKMIQLYSVGKIQYCYRSKIAVEINYSTANSELLRLDFKRSALQIYCAEFRKFSDYYSKDYLGHADISTTEIYARADNEAKHAALEKASLCLELPCASNWEQDADLIAWLSSLG